MDSVNDDIVLAHILEFKQIIGSTNGKLTKSKISPQDYFANLEHPAPELKFPDVGISRTVVSVCELISTLLLEDTDESRAIVMIFEYYFLVAPIVFKNQGAILVNDINFIQSFTEYIKSLFTTRPQAQKELGNTLMAFDLDGSSSIFK